ncbi:hypothetical protein CKA55_07390 [Arcobacter suis]|uniref:Lipoprotein n=1 Tax=Arcobacter suis CECT 7833 TaxID=663365 RepID=A0AAD0SPN1_9BACT|nr:hypothetical protein [Arcobacter suis]AXX89319.1 hypothetical protein ASUIS_0828 [Arcobacter suis CECT 7833]RWS46553.1 hypothetical protein CKA55_07390 [Arcobacter suis]
MKKYSFFIPFLILFFVGCTIKPMEVDLGTNHFNNQAPLNINIKTIYIEKVEKEIKVDYTGFGDSQIPIQTKESTASVVEKDMKEYFSKLVFNSNSNRTLVVTIKEATPYWIFSTANKIPVVGVFSAGMDTDYSLNLNVLFEIEENGKVINSYSYSDVITIKNSASFEEDIKKGYQKLIKSYRNVFFNELESKFLKRYL